ncbi:nimB5 [Drosophila busckii]|uniref:NimB5 n=2 Tax=Drosophila busckii TaxID=30019 RepID=A0A0M3QTX0_DROBS|nr:nimB5 [Drosophila busckii]
MRALAPLLMLLGILSIEANLPEYARVRYDARPDEDEEPRRYYNNNNNNNNNRPQTRYSRPNGLEFPPVPQPQDRKYMKREHEQLSNGKLHKCRIWVPPEIVPKYAQASLIQTDITNKLSMIEVCCTGYAAMRFMGVTVCRPSCSCLNGSCQHPGGCDCYEGFVKNDNGDCVFACPLGCQNGRCFLDGSCQCEPGYKLDETRRFCRPICSSGCDNNPRHNCTAPEICSCAKGYQLTNNGCEPVCDPDCGIGGLCKEQNECDCGSGYKLKDGVCQADCYQ